MKKEKIVKFITKDWVILVILFVFGLLFVTQYSEHLDQKTEQGILYSNALSYCNKTGMFPSFAQRMSKEGIVPIEESIDKDHGEAVFYPLIWIYYVNNNNSFLGNIIWHTYIYCFNFIGVICLYFLLKSIFSKSTAVISTLLFFLTPAMFAHSHYNNKDMILLTLTLIVFYLGYKMTDEKKIKYAVLYGIAGAFCANVKIIGVPIWGFILVCRTVEMLIRKKADGKYFLSLGIASVIAVIGYIAITPASWMNLKDYIMLSLDQAKNFRWGDYVLFNGQAVSDSLSGIPRRYLPVMITMTTPIGILLLILTGTVAMVISTVKSKGDSKILYGIYASVCCFIPLAYAVLTKAVVYNGWRHFYFVYASMIMLAAFGINLCLSLKRKRIYAMIIGAYSVFLLIEILSGNPFQYSYYNEVSRFFVEDRFETDYWNMSFKQAAELIARNDESKHILVSGCDTPTRWGISPAIRTLRGKDRMRMEYTEDWRNSDYVIINFSYSILYSPRDSEYVENNYELIKTFKAYGNKLCAVYKRKE